MKPTLTKAVAVLAVLAGLGVLAFEVRRFMSGVHTEIWFWGTIGVLAIAFGLYELLAGGDERGAGGDEGPQKPRG